MTSLENLALERLGARPGLSGHTQGARLGLHDNVGNDDRACNRVLSRFHKRHLHTRMAVDHRLDLFRMDLPAADVDDPAPSADEIIPVAAQLKHIPRVYKAVLVGEGLALAT